MVKSWPQFFCQNYMVKSWPQIFRQNYMVKSWPQILSTHSKRSLNRVKFAQSGHPEFNPRPQGETWYLSAFKIFLKEKRRVCSPTKGWTFPLGVKVHPFLGKLHPWGQTHDVKNWPQVQLHPLKLLSTLFLLLFGRVFLMTYVRI
jgi:hypothetical protein